MGKGKVIVFSNKKGGVGKTSDTDMTALVASQLFHRRVLLIDVDQLLEKNILKNHLQHA